MFDVRRDEVVQIDAEWILTRVELKTTKPEEISAKRSSHQL